MKTMEVIIIGIAIAVLVFAVLTTYTLYSEENQEKELYVPIFSPILDKIAHSHKSNETDIEVNP